MSVSGLLELVKSYGWSVVAVLAVLGAVVEIAPIKLNPWSRIAKWIGGAVNKDVLSAVNDLRKQEKETQEKLDEHIRIDDERDADLHRYRVLRFNTEILRNMRHTEEEFNEVLLSINKYNRFCKEHSEYENSRAELAIENIKRCYQRCVDEHSFL